MRKDDAFKNDHGKRKAGLWHDKARKRHIYRLLRTAAHQPLGRKDSAWRDRGRVSEAWQNQDSLVARRIFVSERRLLQAHRLALRRRKGARSSLQDNALRLKFSDFGRADQSLGHFFERGAGGRVKELSRHYSCRLARQIFYQRAGGQNL